MTTSELNQYLLANVKCKQGGFLSDSTIGDAYESLRNDASIYCWSGMSSVVRQVSNSADYCRWMQGCAQQMAQSETREESESRILPRAIHCVKSDGDDLCDEQSVGWYLAVYTYMHCLAHNIYSFEAIFLRLWRMYFTETYQSKIR